MDGAAVRVSIVCFSKKKAEFAELDGDRVLHIFSDLTASSSGLRPNEGSQAEAK